MAAAGVLGKASEQLPAPAADAEAGEGPVVAIRPVRVRTDSDGFLETDVVPGTVIAGAGGARAVWCPRYRARRRRCWRRSTGW